jgi:hypothetical protein
MQTELMKQEPQQLEVTPMSMLQMALAKGTDMDQLTKLMELQERWEANEARKAFSVAFSAFKAESIRIVRNITVKEGPLAGKKHADLFGVVSIVTPLMSKHGLSHSWKLTKDEPTWMEVTCTIRHILGHSESVAMGAAPDNGPGRNAIQARGSAKSYLERYTLLGATGLAAAGQDDDGNGDGGKTEGMDASEFDRYMGLIESAANLVTLQKLFTEGYVAAQKVKDQGAMKQLMFAKDARKKDLA